jgi:hypothetical protein
LRELVGFAVLFGAFIIGGLAIALLLSIIEIVLENPLLLVLLAFIFWKLYDEWNHPFRYFARRLPSSARRHQSPSTPKKTKRKGA